MAFQVVPDTASFAHQFAGVVGGPLEGLRAQYTYYVRNQVLPWNVAHLTQTSNIFEDAWNATGDLCCSDQWTLSSIKCRDEGAEFGSQFTNAVATPGVRVGAPAPPNCAVLGQFFNTTGGAPRRAWMFYPFGVETDFNGEVWEAALITLVNTYMDDVDSRIQAQLNGDAIVMVSRHSGTEPDPTARRAVKRAQAITNLVDLESARSVVASIRERRFS